MEADQLLLLINEATDTMAKTRAEAERVDSRLRALKMQKLALEKEKSSLSSIDASETREAWCVDLTEDAAGEVATIEVPGEPGAVLVAPGGRAPSAGDGALLARELMTPEQAFFNAAILPGWQKWMPTFRTGTITAINDDDTADVSLDAATSSAQGLGVNQTSSLSGVPVEYMECNAAAFEVGDACVVRFDGQSWDAPKVVGFVREPKGCGPEFIYVPIRQVTRYLSDPVFTGRYLHISIGGFSRQFQSWYSGYWTDSNGYLPTNGYKIMEVNIKNSYVAIMSEASEEIDGDDVDVFGSSTYIALARDSQAQSIYKTPNGASGSFKTLKIITENYISKLYIQTQTNTAEHVGVSVLYPFAPDGAAQEDSEFIPLSRSIVTGYGWGSTEYGRDEDKFFQDFPYGQPTPDEFVGYVSTSKEADETLRNIFNAPNLIKRISTSGARSTYHLHKYTINGNYFQAIYKRGPAPK